jgi:hypothetical protein
MIFMAISCLVVMQSVVLGGMMNSRHLRSLLSPEEQVDMA